VSAAVQLSHGLDAGGRLVAVGDVERGRACDLRCVGCGGALVAKQGQRRQWHLAHAVEADCNGAFESTLHRLGKQIIAESCSVLLPPVTVQRGRMVRELACERMYEAERAEREVTLGDIRPDVLLHGPDGDRLAVELCVTHASTDAKREALRAMRLDAIEIDLTGLRGRPIGPDIGALVRRVVPRFWLANAAANDVGLAMDAELAKQRAERAAWQQAQAAEAEARRDAAARQAAAEAAREAARLRSLPVDQWRRDIMVEAVLMLGDHADSWWNTYGRDLRYTLRDHPAEASDDVVAAYRADLHAYRDRLRRFGMLPPAMPRIAL
jgi:hypothetical protein